MAIPLAILRSSSRPPSALSLADSIADDLSNSRIATLLDCLPSTNAAAIHSPDLTHATLRHRDVEHFVRTFALPHCPHRKPHGPNDRIMVVLPAGPENALALLAVASYHTCAPVNPSCTAAELLEDARRLNAKAIVTTPDAEERLELRALRGLLGCDILFVTTRESAPCGVFDITVMGEMVQIQEGPSTLHGLGDISLILHTSGTSGKKKVVPYTLLSLIVGSCAVVESWDLQPTDVNLNFMPLFHVGGIVRNLFGPILSGGSAIMCGVFDSVAFWTLAKHFNATWYYAVPTIHHAILASKPDSIIPATDLSIRMVANAAAGLLPALAVELQNTFDAVILPSYGMTECMPVASPPLTYQLDRPGSSGIACGPYLSIRDPLNLESALEAGKTGAICVRGLPTFQGYEVSPDASVSLDTSAFTNEGWFDTGDIGRLDGDGYLFVTGRSKEIINKGGEVISPFEIEEAIMNAAKPYVKTTLAFSIEHDVLQETIGVVIVPAQSQPRIGLTQLQDLLREHLHPSKWPAAVVYMDDLPKNGAGKPLRMNLAIRLGIGRLSDSVPALHRHFEATSPAVNASLADPIRCSRVTFDVDTIQRALFDLHGVHDVAVRCQEDGSPEAFVTAVDEDSQDLKECVSRVLPGYAIPEPLHVFRMKLRKGPAGEIDFAAMEAEITEKNLSAMSETALLLRHVVGKILTIEPSKLTVGSDFFLQGGNSLLLGKLAHQIRKETGVSIPVATLFRRSTIKEIASIIDASDDASTSSASFMGSARSRNHSETGLISPGFDGKSARNQTHPLCLIVQCIPFVFFHPLKAAFSWTVLILTLAEFAPHADSTFWTRIVALLMAVAVARLCSRIMSPLMAIAFKWILIGRLKAGRYRMWSTYYLRYWLVNQSLTIAGRGIFTLHPWLELLYFRLLGARIGKNVKISKEATLGEFDLITLGDGCVVDSASIRGFCVEREGFFTLDKVVVGRSAVINTYTQISPGAVIPDGAVYGPHASSYDAPSPEGFATYNRLMIPEPCLRMKILVAWPAIFFVHFVSYTPWFIVLWLMTQQSYIFQEDLNALESLVDWFATPERVGYHILGRVVRELITPLLQIALGILVKRVLGLNKETNLNPQPTQMCLVRRYVTSNTLSKSALHTAFSILGTHYEVVSIIYRAMGAKIGRRVYWPGSGIYCADPELLEIGDDVVFGSRTEFLTTDGLGSAKITVGDGSMIADRVVLLPGAKIGKLTVMGSGALALRNTDYRDGSTWLGRECLEDGSGKDLNHDLSTPFGRAFHERKAPYFVYPYILILAINILMTAASATYWAIGPISAAQLLHRVDLHESNWVEVIYRPTWFRPAIIYGLTALCFVPILNIQAIVMILWTIATKWIVIGRRRDGDCSWDESSYSQRWQLHLVLSKIVDRGSYRGGVLAPLTGTAYFVWYLRALGAKIGKNCSLYPGGRTGIMTEPDLVQLGDNVSLDDCSVVAHINSRGHFSLHSFEIGNGCAMRTGSRLLSGASMEDTSMLCEHTLLTSGDVADSGVVYSGWPAKEI
ncbi:acetyl-CoA synthetase-like protein [Mycena crocata]|nr:acetyl-CoA synthetase-like protein [Mycena crocata]